MLFMLFVLVILIWVSSLLFLTQKSWDSRIAIFASDQVPKYLSEYARPATAFSCFFFFLIILFWKMKDKVSLFFLLFSFLSILMLLHLFSSILLMPESHLWQGS
jgi:hypothetical protein